VSNIFGKNFRISTFGESHGGGLGVVIDGCPAGLKISEQEIQKELNRRKPGQSKLTTSRKENDKLEILSGILDGVTIGTPIGMIFRNEDARPKAYNKLKDLFRPSHADYTYQMRYGIRDWRGGGRASNRESVARVAAGAVAKKFIAELCGVDTLAWVSSIGKIAAENIDYEKVTLKEIESNLVRCPEKNAALQMEKQIQEAKKQGDSLGGVIHFRIKGLVAGVGAPIFQKLQVDIAQAILSIGACRSFDIGLGADAKDQTGFQHNDPIILKKGTPKTSTNNAGGIVGGISNGEVVYGKVTFKPTATIAKEQQTINTKFEPILFKAQGRHDPCVLPRAVVIVESMINLVLADQLMSYCLADIQRLKKVF
jgi:chorismate synthase